MYFFTADEHLGHHNIIRFCQRPFHSQEEMDEEIIRRHNEVVGKGDLVVHAGDFTLQNEAKAQYYLSRLQGQHIFLRGGHDYWLNKSNRDLWEKKIDGIYVVVCHYAMRVWNRSHHNSWQLHGHSHGQLPPFGKQLDIGVDTHNFYPYSFEEIKTIMDQRPDNVNLA